MADRVTLSFDVTLEEAWDIADMVAGIGPVYDAYNLLTALEEVEGLAPREGQVKRIYIRSAESAELGGVEVDR